MKTVCSPKEYLIALSRKYERSLANFSKQTNDRGYSFDWKSYFTQCNEVDCSNC